MSTESSSKPSTVVHFPFEAIFWGVPCRFYVPIDLRAYLRHRQNLENFSRRNAKAIQNLDPIPKCVASSLVGIEGRIGQWIAETVIEAMETISKASCPLGHIPKPPRVSHEDLIDEGVDDDEEDADCGTVDKKTKTGEAEREEAHDTKRLIDGFVHLCPVRIDNFSWTASSMKLFHEVTGLMDEESRTAEELQKAAAREDLVQKLYRAINSNTTTGPRHQQQDEGESTRSFRSAQDLLRDAAVTNQIVAMEIAARHASQEQSKHLVAKPLPFLCRQLPKGQPIPPLHHTEKRNVTNDDPRAKKQGTFSAEHCIMNYDGTVVCAPLDVAHFDAIMLRYASMMFLPDSNNTSKEEEELRTFLSVVDGIGGEQELITVATSTFFLQTICKPATPLIASTVFDVELLPKFTVKRTSMLPSGYTVLCGPTEDPLSVGTKIGYVAKESIRVLLSDVDPSEYLRQFESDPTKSHCVVDAPFSSTREAVKRTLQLSQDKGRNPSSPPPPTEARHQKSSPSSATTAANDVKVRSAKAEHGDDQLLVLRLEFKEPSTRTVDPTIVAFNTWTAPAHAKLLTAAPCRNQLEALGSRLLLHRLLKNQLIEFENRMNSKPDAADAEIVDEIDDVMLLEQLQPFPKHWHWLDFVIAEDTLFVTEKLARTGRAMTSGLDFLKCALHRFFFYINERRLVHDQRQRQEEQKRRLAQRSENEADRHHQPQQLPTTLPPAPLLDRPSANLRFSLIRELFAVLNFVTNRCLAMDTYTLRQSHTASKTVIVNEFLQEEEILTNDETVSVTIYSPAVGFQNQQQQQQKRLYKLPMNLSLRIFDFNLMAGGAYIVHYFTVARQNLAGRLRARRQIFELLREKGQNVPGLLAVGNATIKRRDLSFSQKESFFKRRVCVFAEVMRLIMDTFSRSLNNLADPTVLADLLPTKEDVLNLSHLDPSLAPHLREIASKRTDRLFVQTILFAMNYAFMPFPLPAFGEFIQEASQRYKNKSNQQKGGTRLQSSGEDHQHSGLPHVLFLDLCSVTRGLVRQIYDAYVSAFPTLHEEEEFERVANSVVEQLSNVNDKICWANITTQILFRALGTPERAVKPVEKGLFTSEQRAAAERCTRLCWTAIHSISQMFEALSPVRPGAEFYYESERGKVVDAVFESAVDGRTLSRAEGGIMSDDSAEGRQRRLCDAMDNLCDAAQSICDLCATLPQHDVPKDHEIWRSVGCNAEVKTPRQSREHFKNMQVHHLEMMLLHPGSAMTYSKKAMDTIPSFSTSLAGPLPAPDEGSGEVGRKNNNHPKGKKTSSSTPTAAAATTRKNSSSAPSAASKAPSKKSKKTKKEEEDDELLLQMIEKQRNLQLHVDPGRHHQMQRGGGKSSSACASKSTTVTNIDDQEGAMIVSPSSSAVSWYRAAELGLLDTAALFRDPKALRLEMIQ